MESILISMLIIYKPALDVKIGIITIVVSKKYLANKFLNTKYF